MVFIPPYVPDAFLAMYLPAIYAGLIVGFIGTMAIALKREEIHILILTDLVGLAMIFVVSAVGTDLAEALILPGLVVELAETLAISEILITREMRKIEQNPRRNLSGASSMFPQSFALNMEILNTAPNFIALVLIGYGIFLTGFTGGAVTGGGTVLYALSKKARASSIDVGWHCRSFRNRMVFMDHRFLIVLCSPSILVIKFIPSSMWITVKSSFKSRFNWTAYERGF